MEIPEILIREAKSIGWSRSLAVVVLGYVGYLAGVHIITPVFAELGVWLAEIVRGALG